ncbi:MAG: ABC-type transport auxiliary lipoprotein family protein [Planctomycetota bacterium]|nr:ABC-type transport auxiliary lipoprotein family protein [Planctomycetota bacterium]
MSNSSLVSILLLTTSSLLCGCDAFKARTSNQVFWSLQPAATSTAGNPSAASDDVVRIRSVGIAQEYRGPQLLYRYAGGRVRSDPQNAWIVPFASMASSSLESALQLSGRFKAVVGPASPEKSTLELQVSVIEVGAEFGAEPTSGKAFVTVLAAWIRSGSPEEVISQSRITVDTPMASDDAQSVTTAISGSWNAVVDKIIASTPALSK